MAQTHPTAGRGSTYRHGAPKAEPAKGTQCKTLNHHTSSRQAAGTPLCTAFPPRSGPNTENNPKPHSSSIKDGNAARQCYIHTRFPPPPAAFVHPQGHTAAAGCGDEGSPKEATALPAFGRCCVSREEFGPDTGLQRGGSAKNLLHR